MKLYKNSLMLLTGLAITLTAFILTPPATAQVEEQIIPPDAHTKAIQALEDLGPTRGALKFDYKMVKILGITTGIEAYSEKIKSALQDLGAKETETEVQIELAGDILFDFDKWNIREDAEESLRKVADIIEAYKKPVVISGHTDAIGADEYNLTLSQKRADAVKQWLVTHAGINAQAIETIGKGESEPAAPNTNPDGSDNPEARQKNRRVEIIIKKK